MAKRNFLVDLDLNQNELQNAVVQNLAAAPANPKAGQEYFNTVDKKKYIFDGENWIDETNQGKIYTFQNGLEELTGADAGKVQAKFATGSHAGNITFSADANGIKADAPAATNVTAGLIAIATDSEASTGTAEGVAVNPKQLGAAVADKIELTDLSIASASANYLTYNSSTGEFGANVDTTVTQSSTNLVTSGAVENAIATAITSAVVYKGTFDITSATDYSGIALPVKAGYLYYVTGTGPVTIDGIEWNAGDFLLINENVSASGTITSAKVQKIDNTEASDIVRLNATQTLTNKTIDADDNTISDLELDNFKSGVVVDSTTGIAATSSASDTKVATEKAIASALDAKTGKFAVQNTQLVPSSGVCTWTISNTLATADVHVSIVEVATGEEVFAGVAVGASNIVVKFNSTANIAADTYRAIVIG